LHYFESSQYVQGKAVDYSEFTACRDWLVTINHQERGFISTFYSSHLKDLSSGKLKDFKEKLGILLRSPIV